MERFWQMNRRGKFSSCSGLSFHRLQGNPMGKKSKSKAGKSEVKLERNARSGKNNLWLILGGAAIMIAIVWVTLHTSSTNSTNSPASTGTSTAEKFEGNKGHATL